MHGEGQERQIVKAYWLFMIGILCGALFGGAVTGYYQAQRFQRLSNQMTFGELSGLIIEEVNTLAGLRKDKPESLIDRKEEELNDSLYTLSQGFPAAAAIKDVARATKLAAGYRRVHPFRSGNQEIDRAVDELLAGASVQGSKIENESAH